MDRLNGWLKLVMDGMCGEILVEERIFLIQPWSIIQDWVAVCVLHTFLVILIAAKYFRNV